MTPLHPTTVTLLNSFIQQFNQHLSDLAGDSEDNGLTFTPVSSAYALAPLLMSLAHGVQQAYPVDCSAPNYSWGDCCLGDLDHSTPAGAAFDSLLEVV
jgi:hypothetical protein